ncbi:hypothetical protein ACE2AJ_09220 [Aquihabitans daechungensis]|uniref:hypothetical protein n=1 Tax=Aquihabitans daechungensis TaxID=1052257 RepID=UPI003B9FD955
MTTATDRPADPSAAAAPLRKTPRPAASTAPTPPSDDGPDGHDHLPPEPPADAGAPVRSPRLPWVLALLGLIGTLAFGLAWANGRDDGSGGAGPSDASAEMLQAARAFSKDLTNFDGATIDRDFDRITARAAGDFRSQADQFFSSEVRAQLKEAQASSRGEIRSAFVQTVEGDRGTVFVVVDQTIANNASPQPQADTLRMELGLVQRDGVWKVERVSVLTAPSAGATGATSPTGETTTTEGGG